MAHKRSSRDDGNFLNLEHEEVLEEMLRAGLVDANTTEKFLRLLASATVYIFYAGTLPNRTRLSRGHDTIPVMSWMRGEQVLTPCFTSLAAIRRSAEGRATFSPIFMPELLHMLGAANLIVNPGSVGEWTFSPVELGQLQTFAPAYRKRTRRRSAARDIAPTGNLEGLFRVKGDE